jgi:hypothetical protein
MDTHNDTNMLDLGIDLFSFLSSAFAIIDRRALLFSTAVETQECSFICQAHIKSASCNMGE